MMNRPVPERRRDILDNVRGLAFVRAAIARAATHDDDPGSAIAYAAARWGADSKAAMYLKAEVPALSTGTADVASEQGAAASEFVGLVREKSVIGKLAGIRRRPSQIRVLEQLTGATGSWVREGKAAPVSSMSFAQTFMRTLKCAALLVQTDEIIRSTDPSAELGIRNDLVNAVAEAIDRSFLDPANAGVADEEPASVTYGLDPILAGAGNDLDDVRDAFVAATANFGGNLEAAYVIARPELLVAISGYSFGGFGRDVGARGGTLGGLPAIASKSLPLDASGGQQMVLIDASGIVFCADEAATEIRVSRQASIEMTDAPDMDGVEPTGASMVSLWQANCVGILAVSHQNWAVARVGSVELMNGLQIAADMT